MKIDIELIWDGASGTFRGSWHGRPVDLPPGALDNTSASAFAVESRYVAGASPQIVRIERPIQHPRARFAELAIDRGDAAAAISELVKISEQVIGRDPELRALRGRARALAGDVTGATSDIAGVLDATPKAHVLRIAVAALAELPVHVAHELVPRVLPHLDAVETPLAFLRKLPDAYWTPQLICAALSRHAAPTLDHPWIVEELVAVAARIGVSPEDIATALGPARSRLDDQRATTKRRTERAALHVSWCRALAARPDAVPRLVELLHALGEHRAPDLVAAIELARPDDSEQDHAELRASLAIEFGKPASPSSIAALQARAGTPLPGDLVAYLELVDGFRPGWTDIVLLDIASIVDRTTDGGSLPVAHDGAGRICSLVARRASWCIEIMQDGDVKILQSFTEWFCGFVAAGLSRL